MIKSYSVESIVHQAHGLTIRSQLPLSGLPLEPGAAAHDLDVLVDPPAAVPDAVPEGEPLLRLHADGTLRYAAAADGTCYVLRFPGCAEFTIDRDLHVVRCRRDPGAEAELASILGAGAVLSFVLTMSGATVLHAGAVEIGDAAVGIVGASGFGKSTVTALLCAGGCGLVTDDLLRVDLSATAPVLACAGADEVRLRPTVRALAACFPGSVGARETADGRLALRPPQTARARLPLAALVVPRRGPAGAPVHVQRLPGAQAMVRLLSFPRLLGWTSTQVLRRQFEALADMAGRVPVFDVRVPSGPPFSADMGVRLRDALAAAIGVRNAEAAACS